MADTLQVAEINDQGLYQVHNLTKGTIYQVVVDGDSVTCGCPSRRPCKHLAAVKEYMQANSQPPQNVTPLQPRLEPNQELLVVMKAIASQNPPNWQRPLRSYPKFDWSKIGASVVSSDKHGATKVAWCGHIYTRRAGENKKYGAAIWFSRAAGKTEDDEQQYLKLITFKDSADAEPLPEYVVRALN